MHKGKVPKVPNKRHMKVSRANVEFQLTAMWRLQLFMWLMHYGVPTCTCKERACVTVAVRQPGAVYGLVRSHSFIPTPYIVTGSVRDQTIP
jgi:hypothetical protein